MSEAIRLHAVLVARRSAQGWRGALLRGASGQGKSDLALRLMGRGWRLVADDQVLMWLSAGRVWGRAPGTLAGLLEVRSVGVLAVPALELAEVELVVDCEPGSADLDRVPLGGSTQICGVSLPCLAIQALDGSAADKLNAYCRSVRL